MKVGVIDYGVGNIGSVLGAIGELRVTPKLIDNPAEIEESDCLILPGVGNFAECMERLSENGWPAALRDSTAKGKPLLGICLGMQLLATEGTEGPPDAPMAKTAGLGLIKGSVVSLQDHGCALRVPHMGWNAVNLQGQSDTLFRNIPDGTDFYFVHSYGFVAEEPDTVVGVTPYGATVTAAIGKGCVWGTQFHPEKSSRAGSRVLSNFLETFAC